MSEILNQAADIAASAIMRFKAKTGGRYYPGYHEDMRDAVKKAILAADIPLTEERDRLREENRASKVLLESKDETIRQLTEERAEQWRQRRDAEGSRDAGHAAADSLRIERDALRETMEGIVHFSDALNFRNDHLSKALSQWIEEGRKLLSPPTAEGREP
ncbi:hypothetical protein R1538_34850 [Rhizobium leguminosarum]|uniref:hypothetical protein n=1 Tax=Rhizobium leguminosarum TaxID=384 RepID=UPI00293DEFEF|nr:hypothetical protein [Rhizobium leguminosarum]MDV4166232.1 hypothetical protein [Rhizobium leguminosarum]